MTGRLAAALAALLLLGTAAAAARPLVVILADAGGTVATDIFTPYAILAESGAVEVKVVAATDAPIRLSPGRARLAPQMTLAGLDRDRPQGPDVVIVPAMEREEDAPRARWLAAQRDRGARIMGICNGARVLAAAGLLDGRAATVHWYGLAEMEDAHPEVRWRRDRRWVTDGPVTTTAGISAAEPAVLHLLEELAGPEVMAETARRVGLPPPDPRHRTGDYRLTIGGRLAVVANRAAFWGHEAVALRLSPGFDAHAFGIAFDAWSRTYRSTAWAVAAGPVASRHGLQVLPSPDVPHRFDREVALPQGDAMEATFEAIGRAYGGPTARFVALQFEHPYGAVAPDAW